CRRSGLHNHFNLTLLGAPPGSVGVYTAVTAASDRQEEEGGFRSGAETGNRTGLSSLHGHQDKGEETEEDADRKLRETETESESQTGFQWSETASLNKSLQTDTELCCVKHLNLEFVFTQLCWQITQNTNV
uniref:Uncharacterized protein n=1 Tax=Sparus aurata TaxID=8175 RepID=A0A671WNW3_SPAAU